MLPMMLVDDKNGMLCPLNNTSSTIPRASRLTPTSASADAHAFILFKISIEDLLSKFVCHLIVKYKNTYLLFFLVKTTHLILGVLLGIDFGVKLSYNINQGPVVK